MHASRTSSVKAYIAIYSQTSTSSSNHSKKAIITIASTAQSLDIIEALHNTIRSHSSIPLPALLKRDDTTSLIAHPYSLYSHPSGVSLRDLYPKSPPSSETKPHSDRDPDKALFLLKTELKLGSLTKTLHERVQNDWFGLPGEDAENKKEWGECYSWQEGFTILLENALEEAEGLLKKASSKVPSSESEGVAGADDDDDEIPIKDIHRLLSRAIGSFLFDDVEVPSLIFHPCPSVSGWLSRIFVSDKITNPAANAEEPEIAGLLGCESCIWGDPLLEGCFSSSINDDSKKEGEGEGEGRKLEWPSKAFLEGYASTPIVLPRHRTKRLWYDLFAALRALAVFLFEDSDGDAENDKGGKKNGVVKEMVEGIKEIDSDGDAENDKGGKKNGVVKKKVEGIKEIVRKLENAPCY
ncbi:hypothetical protein A7U60_g2060 [Sanghuangporus baumii]|uniref:Uncharacterized protein n=1 Tax=Sanghuangporus baumii TaxID=108892 RepID=A0A9Q5I2W8_SANBA|nr:hypothetical protein A7U60_g2060 [Sanghuangporus baumii]